MAANASIGAAREGGLEGDELEGGELQELPEDADEVHEAPGSGSGGSCNAPPPLRRIHPDPTHPSLPPPAPLCRPHETTPHLCHLVL